MHTSIVRAFKASLIAAVVVVLHARPALAAGTGAVETPTHQTPQTGIGLISGWHCTGKTTFTVELSGSELSVSAAYSDGTTESYPKRGAWLDGDGYLTTASSVGQLALAVNGEILRGQIFEVDAPCIDNRFTAVKLQ